MDARMVVFGEIDSERADIGLGHSRIAQALANYRSHRGCCRSPMQGPESGAEVAHQLVLRPRNGRGIGLGQRRRYPAVDHGARISVPDFFGTERVTRRMTAPAIAERLG